jgi:hypothetical protein
MIPFEVFVHTHRTKTASSGWVNSYCYKFLVWCHLLQQQRIFGASLHPIITHNMPNAISANKYNFWLHCGLAGFRNRVVITTNQQLSTITFSKELINSIVEHLDFRSLNGCYFNFNLYFPQVIKQETVKQQVPCFLNKNKTMATTESHVENFLALLHSHNYDAWLAEFTAAKAGKTKSLQIFLFTFIMQE